MSKAERASWDMVQHLTDKGMCDAFLAVARDRYPDLLLRVRESIARAMSGWLLQDGYRADVQWSGTHDCFVGRVKFLDVDGVFFKGVTPAEVHDAFLAAVRSVVDGADPLQALIEAPAQPGTLEVVALPAPVAPARKQRKRVKKPAAITEAEIVRPPPVPEKKPKRLGGKRQVTAS